MQHPHFVFFDMNKQFIDQYESYLKNKIPYCTFAHDNLEELIKNKKINAIVSPANSYGFMNGGIDRVIDELLDNVEPIVKQRINQVGVTDNSGRKFLPVGKCEIVKQNNYYLFVAPTMKMPGTILKNDYVNIALTFKAILEKAYELSNQGCNLTSQQQSLTIACPCLGTGVGHMDALDSAKQIYNAYMFFVK